MKRIFYFLILLLWVACENDESFSTSSGLKLDFSVDTLKMDTVFSQTPSSTYSFWVHNRNNDGLRLSTIRLKRGNQSGFRVNVDGVYLDNSNGSLVNDVEIRRKDSLLVFVELTAQETHQLTPQRVEDELLFQLESGAEQRVLLSAWTWDAKKLFDPVIDRDSLIESTSPIIIYGEMVVKEGVTLTLKNSMLFFHAASGLSVYGSLKTENCTMRGDRLDDMFSYLPYDRISGQWNGIHLYGSSTDNHLVDTEIRNANYGLICDSAAIDSTQYRLQMERCVVHNCVGTCVETINSNIKLEDCQLTNSGGNCLSVIGGLADINYCTMAQFYPFSAGRRAALSINSHVTGVTAGISHSIVTGYADDEVMVEQASGPLSYRFADCLLRTPKVEGDTTHLQNIIWETPNDSIQGKKHFIKIDEDNFDYDFHLDSLSTAKGLGCYR